MVDDRLRAIGSSGAGVTSGNAAELGDENPTTAHAHQISDQG